jgi:hypothetical protein
MSQHFGRHRAHHQVDQRAVTVRAHDDHVKLAGLGELGNGFAGVPDLPAAFGVDAMAQQLLGHWCQHLLGFFGVVLVDHLFSHRCPCPWRQHGLHGESAEVVALGEQFVRGQIRQHFLGKGTAVDGKKNLHISLLGQKPSLPTAAWPAP